LNVLWPNKTFIRLLLFEVVPQWLGDVAMMRGSRVKQIASFVRCLRAQANGLAMYASACHHDIVMIMAMPHQLEYSQRSGC
jgi:hypothetical protein